MWSSARSRSIASAPIRELGISDRPDERSSASIASAARSAASAATGRRVSALREPVGELVAVELLARAVALDHDQARGLDTLVGGEPRRARRALPPAPDRRRLVEVAGVDDARVTGAALRTAHEPSSWPHHNP